MVSTSEAITGGALGRSQVYLQYPGDLELWVNGSTNRVWDVRVARDTWRLPPSGWVAVAPGFLEVSAEVDGGRLDYLETADFVYYDGRGRTLPFRGWEAESPLAVRYHPDADPPSMEVLDIGGSGRFTLAPRHARAAEVDVLDLAGTPAGPASFTNRMEGTEIQGPPGPHRYRIRLQEPGRPAPVSGAPVEEPGES
jgi:hypothetical protein